MGAGEFWVCFVELGAVQAHGDGAVGAALSLWLEQTRPCLCPSWGFLRVWGAEIEIIKPTQGTFLILPGAGAERCSLHFKGATLPFAINEAEK